MACCRTGEGRGKPVKNSKFESMGEGGVNPRTTRDELKDLPSPTSPVLQRNGAIVGKLA